MILFRKIKKNVLFTLVFTISAVWLLGLVELTHNSFYSYFINFCANLSTIIYFFSLFWTTSLYTLFFFIINVTVFLALYLFKLEELNVTLFKTSIHFLFLFHLIIFYTAQTFVLGETLRNINTWDHVELNFLLINSLSVIHPFLLYCAVIIFVLNTLLFNFQCFSTFEAVVYTRLTLYRLTIVTVQFFINALFLGGWWAHQEGTWGGWWGWDASEVQGLFLLLLTVLCLHRQLKDCSLYAVRHTFFIIILLHLLFFSAIQIDFSTASHNFGKLFEFANLKEIFFIQIIYFLCIYIIYFFIFIVIYEQKTLLFTYGRETNSVIKIQSHKFKWLMILLLSIIIALVKLESLNITRDQIHVIGLIVVCAYNFQYWKQFETPLQLLTFSQINLYFVINIFKLKFKPVPRIIHLVVMYLLFIIFENTHFELVDLNSFSICGNIFSLQFPVFKFSSVWKDTIYVIYDKTLYNYSTTSNKGNLSCYSYESALITVLPCWSEAYYSVLQSSSVQPKVINGFDLLLMSLLLITFAVFHVKQLIV